MFLTFSCVGEDRSSVRDLSKLREEEANTPLTATVATSTIPGYYEVSLPFTIHTFDKEYLFSIHIFVSNELTQTNTILPLQGIGVPE